MTPTVDGPDERDQNADRLALSKRGLWMTFGRELSPKYTRPKKAESGTESGPKWNDPDLGQPNAWRVAGYYDFLKIKEINALDDLHDDRNVWQQPHRGRISEESLYPSWMSSSDLVLISFKNEAVDRNFCVALTCPEYENPAASPMLAMIRITLSPALLQAHGKALSAIANTIELLQRASKDVYGSPATVAGAQVRYFTSLGGPDVVAVALPKTPAELRSIHRLACLVRHLSMASVVKGEWCTDYNDEHYPGHACVLVEPVMAFSEHALERFSKPDFRQAEKDLQLALTYHLRLDCGHGEMVADHIRQVVSSSDEHPPSESLKFRVNWTRHALEGEFEHLSDLVRVWDALWFSGKGEGSPKDPKHDWRERNLSDSITSLAFPADRCDACPFVAEKCKRDECHEKRVWRLTEEVDQELGLIRENLLTFSHKYLGRLQCDELMGIFVSFCSALYRPELLGAVLDVYPFMMQLGRALKHEHWQTYLAHADPDKGPFASEDFDSDQAERDWNRFNETVQDLLEKLKRAVRNRVEHRSTQGDPPLTHILSHGACKLINAYSVVFWLAAELFRQHSTEYDLAGDGGPEIGNPAHFAALVSAGTRGRIECEELFADFRRSVEKEEEKRNGKWKLLSQIPLNDWSSRLLLLDISGPLLLRPELCFACCLHEMAELSEWIHLPQTEPVRRAINLWILQTIADELNQATVSLSFKEEESEITDEQREKARRQLMKRYSLPFARLCAMTFPTQNLAVGEKNRSTDRVEEYCGRARSTLFVSDMISSIEKGTAEMLSGTDPRGKHIWDALRQMDGVPPVAEHGEDVLQNDSFNAAVDTLIEFVPEVIADVGMWCALDHILGKGCYRDQSERIEDLNRVFMALMQTTAECQHPGQRPVSLYNAILLRWVIQAAALTPEDERETGWQDGIKECIKDAGNSRGSANTTLLKEEEIQGIFDAAVETLPMFGPSGLVDNLAELPSYASGPPEESLNHSMFPSEDKLADAVRELLESFRLAWKEGRNDARPPAQDGSKIMDFVFSLWAASTEFGCSSALEKILVQAEDESEE